MRKIISIVTLSIFIIPQVAFAAWWNPLTWFTYENKAQNNLETTTKVFKKDNIEINSRVDNETLIEAEVKSRVEATLKVRMEEQAKIDAAVKSALDKQSAKISQQKAEQEANLAKNQTIQPQVQISNQQPSVSSTEKNYYYDTKNKITTLLNIKKTYKIWLQDTSNQFRSMSLTLSGYNVGGLYGQSRDAAIDLANANIAVIDDLLVNTDESISYYQDILDILNNLSTEFVNKSSFNKIVTPEETKRQIDQVKKSINSSLMDVMNSLKYH